MHRAVYMVLLAASSLAHYQIFDTRNLIEREELESEEQRERIAEALLRGYRGVGMEKLSIKVDCPVCEDNVDSMHTNDEQCLTDLRGRRYKKCYHGTYYNAQCGNRLDCYRGPGENCSHQMSHEDYGHRCLPGYYCHMGLNKCTGIDYTPETNDINKLEHSFQYPTRANRSLYTGMAERGIFF